MVLTDRSAQLMAQAFVESLYTYRDYAPLWSYPTQLRAFEAPALDSRMEGLPPADYVSASRPKLGSTSTAKTTKLTLPQFLGGRKTQGKLVGTVVGRVQERRQNQH